MSFASWLLVNRLRISFTTVYGVRDVHLHWMLIDPSSAVTLLVLQSSPVQSPESFLDMQTRFEVVESPTVLVPLYSKGIGFELANEEPLVVVSRIRF